MAKKHPPEPTSEQCDACARLGNFNSKPSYACWYPQMGGYVGKAVVVVDSPCFEAWVWHNGEFPFSGEYEHMVSPTRLHHCDPTQFTGFGTFVATKQHEHFPEDKDDED